MRFDKIAACRVADFDYLCIWFVLIMRIGLFGGSFNPIHKGHVIIGRTLMKEHALDEVWYMVSPQNPWKAGSAELLPEDVRYQLVVKALEGEEGLVAKDYEFHLPRPSYTWETLQALKRDYPDHEFVLLVGGDNWKSFHRWAHSEDIRRNHQIAVFPRDGQINISSTDVRRMVKEGKDVSAIVPEKIVDEVAKLYQ